MKRSEMVMHIARSLMSHLDMDKEERFELADSLLSDIEIEGMLPPKQSIPSDSKGSIGTGYKLYRVNEWEPEDE